MSAPSTTGSLLLLQQHYKNLNSGSNMLAATLKALAIHTADEAGDNDGPDYVNGWGLLNTKKSAEVISENGGNNHRIIETVLNQGATYELPINSGGIGSEIKVTVVWADPPGTPPAATVDPTNVMLVNDLDLRVVGNSTTYFPWTLDPATPAAAAATGDNVRDNVEQVLIPLTDDGIYTIQVSHKGTLVDDSSAPAPQAFSLIISTQPSNNYELIEGDDFNLGSLPTGWEINELGGHGLEWRFDDPGARTNLTGGDGDFAIADSMVGGCYLMNTELKMPPLNLSNYSNVTLFFKNYISLSSGKPTDYTNVEVTTNGGGTWTPVWDREGGNAEPGASNIGVDISALADGENDVWIRFLYDNTTVCYIWQVDDVEVWGIPSSSICGDGYELPANQWTMISLPCDPGASNTVSDLFDDDFVGAYGTTWRVFERDEDTNQYVLLASDTPLIQGQGYWIKTSETGVTLDLTGTGTAGSLTVSADCPDPTNGCLEIPLTPPTAPDTALFNLQGHPFPYSVDWADVRIRVAGDVSSPFTPEGANSSGYLSKNVYTYNGNAYDTFDDVTPGMQGVLGAYDGIWVEALNNTLSSGDLTLLVPPTRSFGIIMASQDAAVGGLQDFLAAADATPAKRNLDIKKIIWWDFWVDWLIPQAHAASLTHTKKTPPGLSKRDAHRATHAKAVAEQKEWYIRLTVEADGMRDRGNVLGQLGDSEYDYDHHDLKELKPFGNRYLTVVFPHMDWAVSPDDYTSDFHPVGKKNESDFWKFEVRTGTPDQEVTLFWSGPTEELNNSWIIDEETGEMIEPLSGGKYTFVMGTTIRSFTWHYSGKKKSKKK